MQAGASAAVSTFLSSSVARFCGEQRGAEQRGGVGGGRAASTTARARGGEAAGLLASRPGAPGKFPCAGQWSARTQAASWWSCLPPRGPRPAAAPPLPRLRPRWHCGRAAQSSCSSTRCRIPCKGATQRGSTMRAFHAKVQHKGAPQCAHLPSPAERPGERQRRRQELRRGYPARAPPSPPAAAWWRGGGPRRPAPPSVRPGWRRCKRRPSCRVGGCVRDRWSDPLLPQQCAGEFSSTGGVAAGCCASGVRGDPLKAAGPCTACTALSP